MESETVREAVENATRWTQVLGSLGLDPSELLDGPVVVLHPGQHVVEPWAQHVGLGRRLRCAKCDGTGWVLTGGNEWQLPDGRWVRGCEACGGYAARPGIGEPLVLVRSGVSP
jgi:hypothetical protein